MNPAELCRLVSTLPPDQWPEEVLFPIAGQPVSIFGYHQAAMDRAQSVTLIDALVRTGLANSNNLARTAIKSNAVSVNRSKATDIARILTAADALPNLDAIVLELGKYNFGIIELC